MEELVNETVTETGLAPKQVRQVVELLKEGNTVPFIARYRKEQTGGLDELQIKAIADAHEYAESVMQRREEVLRLIDEQGKLTAELKAQIKAARKLQTLEDLYRPYKQKRRTRATAAKEKGLEPLAQEIVSFPREFSLETATTPFINQELGVPDSETAIAGAKDILAEMFAEDPEIRSTLRERALKQSTIETSRKNGGAEDEKGVYALYYDFQEPIKKWCPTGHSPLTAVSEKRYCACTYASQAMPLSTKLNASLSKSMVHRSFPLWKRRLKMHTSVWSSLR